MTRDRFDRLETKSNSSMRLTWSWLAGVAMVCLLALLLTSCASPESPSSRSTRSYLEPAERQDPGLSGVLTLPGDELWVVARSGSTNRLETAENERAVARGASAIQLLRTEVAAEITGWIAAVRVDQDIENRSAKPNDAVYRFELPPNAAVNDFVVTIGDRHIRAIVRERVEAERLFALARERGYLVSLLDQDSPHTFRQSLGRIPPKSRLRVSLGYAQPLLVRQGWCEFKFPIAQSAKARGSAQFDRAESSLDRQEAPIFITVESRSGFDEFECPGREATNSRLPSGAVKLSWHGNAANATNDFLCRYRVAEDAMKARLYSYRDRRGGFFALTVAAPKESAAPTKGGIAQAPRDNSSIQDLDVDWGGLRVADIYPKRWIEMALGDGAMCVGRFGGEGALGGISVKARIRGAFVRVPVEVISVSSGEKTTSAGSAPASIPTIWAGLKLAAALGNGVPEAADSSRTAIETALDYGIISPWTSFGLVDVSTRSTATSD